MQNKLHLMGFLCPRTRFHRRLQNFNLVLNAKVSFNILLSNIIPITVSANIKLNALAQWRRERQPFETRCVQKRRRQMIQDMKERRHPNTITFCCRTV